MVPQDYDFADYNYDYEQPPTSIASGIILLQQTLRPRHLRCAHIVVTVPDLGARLAWSPKKNKSGAGADSTKDAAELGSPKQLLPEENGLATHRTQETQETALEYSDDERETEAASQQLANKERALRRKHNEELLKVLESEQVREQERLQALSACTDGKEKARLEVIFGEERTKSSERILNLSMQHEQELDTLRAKYK